MSKTKGMMEIKLTNLPQVVKQLQGLQKGGEKALERTVSDFKTRAPAWVSKAVRKYYKIPAEEISHTNKGKGKNAGRVRITGRTISTTQLVYQGRPLTPTHFKMEPEQPERIYELKTKIKNRKRRLGGKKELTERQKTNIGRNFTHQGKRHKRKKDPILLVHTGAKSYDKTQYIPMRLLPSGKWKAVKTVSLPKMVNNQKVREEIDQAIEEKLSKRLENHIKYCVNKYAK